MGRDVGIVVLLWAACGSVVWGEDNLDAKRVEAVSVLLAQAMKDTGRCAIAKYAARGKMYIVLLRPFDRGIVMQQLHYNDEIRTFGEVPFETDVKFKKGELDLAKQLIDQIASDAFDADEYEDEVRARVWTAIQQKVEGEEVTAPLEEAPKAQIVDLMEALKASLGVDAEADSKAVRKGPRRSPRTAKKTRSRKKAATG